MTRITIRRPDDWHLHLRDGDMLRTVAPASRDFGRAIVMPNLVPPVVTAADALAYRERVLAALPDEGPRPLMTLYLTEATDPDDVARAFGEGIAVAVKLYPAGATTNSQSGVRDMDAVRPVLERMAEIGMPLCIHGEVTDRQVDIFDREAVFIERVLDPLRRAVPGLRVVLEHVTTSDGIDYVRGGGASIAATITVHHLILNRNDLFAGGIRPHLYCLPIVKRERHRAALVAAAISADPAFFLGTDSAPHPREAKESACGCAGVFTAPVALPCLAHVFEAEGALDRLEAFASLNGARFYGHELAEETLRLERGESWRPEPVGDVEIFDPGFPLHWRVAVRPAGGPSAGGGDPWGNRTPLSSVRGWRPNR